MLNALLRHSDVYFCFCSCPSEDSAVTVLRLFSMRSNGSWRLNYVSWRLWQVAVSLSLRGHCYYINCILLILGACEHRQRSICCTFV
jgi:hypothetical protein